MAGADGAQIKSAASLDVQAGPLNPHFDLMEVLTLKEYSRRKGERVLIARLLSDIGIKTLELGLLGW